MGWNGEEGLRVGCIAGRGRYISLVRAVQSDI